MTVQNLDYYRQRADEEWAAAEQAGDPTIAQIHREMAQRYREMLSEAAGRADGDATMAASTGGPIAQPGAAFG